MSRQERIEELSERVAELEAKLVDIAAHSHGKGQEDGLRTAYEILAGEAFPAGTFSVSELLAKLEALKPGRRRLPETRPGVTRKFHIRRPEAPLKMWVTISTFPDGRPGEIFIKADKSGSLASGALDAVAITLSMAWQHGVPFEPTMQKFVGMRFEPNGITGDEAYPIVASALDYIARWALDKFGKKEG